MKDSSALEVIEIIQGCKATSDDLAAGEGAVFRWAEGPDDLFGAYFSELERHLDIARELPQEWHRLTSNQYVAGRIYGSEPVLHRCLRDISTSLGERNRLLFGYFAEVPWRYSLFSVEKKLADTLFRIVDYCSEETLLLHSRSLEDLHKRGVPLFFTLLFDNGQCFQTYGPLHYFRGFAPFDFDYFARILQPRAHEKGGLAAAVARDPVPFLLLDRWAEIPPIAHGGVQMETCFHSAHAESFDPEAFVKSQGFSIEKKRAVARLGIPGGEEPFHYAYIYYDLGREEIAVHTAGMSLYKELRRALSPDVELPEYPDWHASANMETVASVLLGRKPPEERWNRIFDEEGRESPEQIQTIAAMNAFMAEMSHCSNQGLPFDLEEAARRHGVPLDVARGIAAEMDRIERRFDIHLEGGLPGFSPPPPVTRLKMKAPLEAGGLFRFEEAGRARQLFKGLAPGLEGLARSVGREAPSLEELPGMFEDLGLRFWKATDPTILSYALFMLARAGAKPHPAADYATEVIRIFWQVLLPNHSRKHVARFTGRFEMFCEEILAPAGLVVVSGAADRPEAPARLYIKRSEFFDAWVRMTE